MSKEDEPFDPKITPAQWMAFIVGTVTVFLVRMLLGGSGG